MKKPEILAPTSTMESVTAALNGGCDAIYIGGKDFSARQYAANPSDNELKDIIDICRLRGVKVFITLNILYKENEMNSVLEFVSKVYEWGAYGLIVQDTGAASIIREHFPNIAISASTQMAVYSNEGTALLKDMGYDRAVLARELSLDEVKEICRSKGNMETEVFVHGALCVCVSGRCLFSSVIGGRSGNRGRCAQPCRMKYGLYKDNKLISSGHLLSPKDIQTVEILDKITEAGVDSLKIEGRMKTPEYVYSAVSAYRKYTDMAYKGRLSADEEDIKELLQVFSRGGSSSHGYYDSFSGSDMMSTLSPKSSGVEIGRVTECKRNCCIIELYEDTVPGDGIEVWSSKHWGTYLGKGAQKGSSIKIECREKTAVGDRVFRSFDKTLNDRLKKTYNRLTRQREINVSIKAKANEPLELRAEGITVTGGIGQVPQSRPMTAEMTASRISKTGDTPFKFKITDIDTDSVYFPVSVLNNARRELCARLEEKILREGRREKIKVKYSMPPVIKAKEPVITALVRTEEQLRACIDAGVKRIYCEMRDEKYIPMCHGKGIEIYFALPHIARERTYQQYIDRLEKTDCDGYLIRSLVNINTDKKTVADHSLNVFNSRSRDVLKKIYSYVTLSVELSKSELTDIADDRSEVVVYGRLPLMTTNQCPAGLYEAKKGREKFCALRHKRGNYMLKDRTGAELPIIRNCDECYALILSPFPMYAGGRDITDIGAKYLRMEFTTEDHDTAFKTAREYISMAENKSTRPEPDKAGGHFHRGVM